MVAFNLRLGYARISQAWEWTKETFSPLAEKTGNTISSAFALTKDVAGGFRDVTLTFSYGAYSGYKAGESVYQHYVEGDIVEAEKLWNTSSQYFNHTEKAFRSFASDVVHAPVDAAQTLSSGVLAAAEAAKLGYQAGRYTYGSVSPILTSMFSVASEKLASAGSTVASNLSEGLKKANVFRPPLVSI